MESNEHHIVVLAKNIQGKHQANVVIYPTTGVSLEYRNLIKGPTKSIWEKLFANETGRLAQGVGTRIPSGTNIILFIPKEKLPAGRRVTHEKIVAEIWPQKAETNRTRLNFGGNIINFPGEVTKYTSYLTTAKLIFNSVLSTKNKKFMCANIYNFYLNNPMERYEYMKLPLGIIPDKIIQKYKLQDPAKKIFVHM